MSYFPSTCPDHTCTVAGCTTSKSSRAEFCEEHTSAGKSATAKKKKTKKNTDDNNVVTVQPKALNQAKYQAKEAIDEFCGPITFGEDIPVWASHKGGKKTGVKCKQRIQI